MKPKTDADGGGGLVYIDIYSAIIEEEDQHPPVGGRAESLPFPPLPDTDAFSSPPQAADGPLNDGGSKLVYIHTFAAMTEENQHPTVGGRAESPPFHPYRMPMRPTDRRRQRKGEGLVTVLCLICPVSGRRPRG